MASKNTGDSSGVWTVPAVEANVEKIEAESTDNKQEADAAEATKGSTQGSRKRVAPENALNTSSVIATRRQSTWVGELEREKDLYEDSPAKKAWAVVLIFLLVASLTALYITCFSFIQIDIDGVIVIGAGDEVFTNLVAFGESAREIAGIKLAVNVLLYVFTGLTWFFIYFFDVRLWTGGFFFLGRAIIFAGIALLFISSLLSSKLSLAAPLMGFFLDSMVLFYVLKVKILPRVSKTFFIAASGVAFFLGGTFVLVLLALSMIRDGFLWNESTKIVLAPELGCSVSLANITASESNATFEFGECDIGFLIWLSPILYVVCVGVIAGCLFFLRRAELERMKSLKAVKFEPLAQVFMTFVLLSFVGVWVAASIASATSAFSDTVLSFSMLTMIISMIIVVAVFGIKYVVSQIRKTSLGIKFLDFLSSDWGKGLMVVVLFPAFTLFLGINYLKQRVRVLKGVAVAPEDNFTKPVQQMVNSMRTWEWGSVIQKALLFGMVYFFFNVGVTRAVVVFLSYLKEQLATVSIFVSTAVFIVVGLILFLLPPVPGIPIYITAGIVLVSQAEVDLGFIGGIFYTLLICLLLKLLALILQQKVIGEMFGASSVKVRLLVNVNSVELRAMRRALLTPGLSFGKVVILIGGPDWPTSVLTGIMRLNVFQMLLGTTPVIFLIAPCVLTGAFLVKQSEDQDSIFASLSALSVIATVIVQGGAMLGAIQKIAEFSVKFEKELSEEEPDLEVLELENKNKAFNETLKGVTQWTNLSQNWKNAHFMFLVVMSSTCYAFNFLGGELFQSFEVSDSIDEDLDGNALNLVKPAGWAVLAVFFLAMGYYFVFTSARKREAKRIFQANQKKEVPSI